MLITQTQSHSFFLQSFNRKSESQMKQPKNIPQQSSYQILKMMQELEVIITTNLKWLIYILRIFKMVNPHSQDLAKTLISKEHPKFIRKSDITKQLKKERKVCKEIFEIDLSLPSLVNLQTSPW
jgi:hypothetical protein